MTGPSGGRRRIRCGRRPRRPTDARASARPPSATGCRPSVRPAETPLRQGRRYATSSPSPRLPSPTLRPRPTERLAGRALADQCSIVGEDDIGDEVPVSGNEASVLQVDGRPSRRTAALDGHQRWMVFLPTSARAVMPSRLGLRYPTSWHRYCADVVRSCAAALLPRRSGTPRPESDVKGESPGIVGGLF